MQEISKEIKEELLYIQKDFEYGNITNRQFLQKVQDQLDKLHFDKEILIYKHIIKLITE